MVPAYILYINHLCGFFFLDKGTEDMVLCSSNSQSSSSSRSSSKCSMESGELEGSGTPSSGGGGGRSEVGGGGGMRW